MKQFSTLFFLLLPLALLAQFQTQTVRGTVYDDFTGQPLQGAVVQVEGLKLGSVTDESGQFRIEAVPLGRHRFTCQYIGYADYLSDEVIVSSVKEVVLVITLEEKGSETEEVLITSQAYPKKAINEFAVVSTRSFSAEETRLYAASVNDPGRMAVSFAGVQVGADEDENDIIVRGNSSFGVLWRLEGIDIPNPNHFARPGTSGGGITVFSAQLLSNSDFSTGAFPAEYGNAISGVFDVNFRKGNMEQREHRFRLSMIGIDLATEGYFSKGRSSYLANYRFSTLSILNRLGFELVGENVDNDFQDFSFNLAFNGKGNRSFFTVFGMGGLSRERYRPREDTTQWENPSHWTDRIRDSKMATVGATFTHLLNEQSYLKAVVAANTGLINWWSDTLNPSFDHTRVSTEDYEDRRISASLAYHRKLGARTRLKAGFFANQIFYRFRAERIALGTEDFDISLDGEGSTQLLQAYAMASHRMGSRFTFNGGLHLLYLTLNGSISAEPRISALYQLDEKQSLSLGYGLHGQHLPLGTYFVVLEDENGNPEQPNKDLDLVKSHHFVLSYNLIFARNFRLRAELYYQSLYNVPVEPDNSSSFWLLNNQSGFVEDRLVSEGTGQNYGMDLAVEKFFSGGFYFLLTGSFFRSQFQPLNGMTFSTRFDSRFSSSFTTGKEWTFNNQGVLQAGFKALFTGGFRYTPADAERSKAEGRFVPDDSRAFSEQVNPFFRIDGRVAYRINRPGTAWEISLDVQNVLNRQNTTGQGYDPNTDTFYYRYQGELIPVLSFQVDF